MDSTRSQHGTATAKHAAFPTTHWSLVLEAGGRATRESSMALDALCKRYWKPLYAFVRRKGHTHHEAEDMTQQFLLRLLEGGGVARARPERGRFRTFLLTSMRNFLTNEWHRVQAAKRGDGRPLLSLQFDDAARNLADEPVDPALTPEAAFDRSWALGVIDRALGSLREEYQTSGRIAFYEAVAPIVWGGGAREPLAAHAARLGMTEGALKVAVHRLRKRLREHVAEAVAQTVATPEEVADEVRYLIAAVRGNSLAR